MKTRLLHVTLVTETGVIAHSAIDVEEGKIVALYEGKNPDDERDQNEIRLIDGKGMYAVPGFVDIHVHGGGGIEFMNASWEEIQMGCMAHARHGTTTLLPTTLAAGKELTKKMIENVRKAKQNGKERLIGGIHLEGPFLSPLQSGAQSREDLALPNEKLLDELIDIWPKGVRIIGAAPELPGGMELGDWIRKRGILASIAHSDADYQTCMTALKHGYTDITHIYSGCSMVHRENGYRHGGVVEAGLLEDDFSVQVIADGKHLPPELLRLIVKNKGADRISLITDALFAAGTDFPDGMVLRQANGIEAILEDGVMKLPSRQAFAGSIATMDQLVQTMVHLAKVPIWDAIKMASSTPARRIGLEKEKGYLKVGYDADIVLLDHELNVQYVMVGGTILDRETGEER